MQCFRLNPQRLYGIATEIIASSLPRTRTGGVSRKILFHRLAGQPTKYTDPKKSDVTVTMQ